MKVSLPLLLAALVLSWAVCVRNPGQLVELWLYSGVWSWVYLALFVVAAAWTLHASLRYLRGGSAAGWTLLLGPAALVAAGGLATLIQMAQVHGVVESHPELATVDVLATSTAIILTSLLLALLWALPLLLLSMVGPAWRALIERAELRIARGVAAAAAVLLVGLVLAAAQGVGVRDWQAYHGQDSLSRQAWGAAEVVLAKMLLEGTGLVGLVAIFCALLLGLAVAAGAGRDPGPARARVVFIAAVGLGSVLLAGAAATAGATAQAFYSLQGFSVDARASMLTRSISLVSAEDAMSMGRAMAGGILVAGALSLLLLFRSAPRPGAREALAALPPALLLAATLAVASVASRGAESLLTAELEAEVPIAVGRNGRGLPRLDLALLEPVLPRTVRSSLIELDERRLRFRGEPIEHAGEAGLERLKELLVGAEVQRANLAVSADLRAGELLPLLLGIAEVVPEQALLMVTGELRLTRRHSVAAPITRVPVKPAPAGTIEGRAYMYKVPGRLTVSLEPGGKEFLLDSAPYASRELAEVFASEDRITLLVDPNDGVEELLRTLVSARFLFDVYRPRMPPEISVALTTP